MKGKMNKLIIMSVLAVALCGCNTVRKSIGVAESAVNAAVAVKDDVFGAAKTLVNAAESVKTNALTGASATANAATQ